MMRLDSLADRPDRAGRFLARFSDGSVLRLYRQTIEDLGLYAGLELTQRQMEDLRAHAGQTSAKMRAVRIVSAASVSRKDLETRLVQKGEDPGQAREAVNWLSDMALLDDGETARQLVAQCIRKGYGKARAKQALYEKQIPKALWEDALRDYPDQREAILAYLKSKIASRDDPREVKRAVDALLRRGHSYCQIRSCLAQLDLEHTDFQEEF